MFFFFSLTALILAAIYSVNNPEIQYALFLSFIAGISTSIGALIPKLFPVNIQFSLSLAAGVMVFVSFCDMIPEAVSILGHKFAYFCFFLGILAIKAVNFLLPEQGSAFFIALAISVHNFPEGLATLLAGQHKKGIAMCFAISLHNIPEGMSVAIPLLAEGNPRAFEIASFSGLMEPLGALFFHFLWGEVEERVFGIFMAGIAGIMVYIGICEMKPQWEGFVTGMAVMALGVVLME